jgi:hypothetical protein
MEKNKLNEGKESLERIKLLMSYRNDMTLTENVNIIEEQSNEISDTDLQNYVDKAVDYLDGYVTAEDLVRLAGDVALLSTKKYKGKNGLIAFIEYYSIDEGGDNFLDDIDSVGVKSVGVQGVNAKNNMITLINKVQGLSTDDGKTKFLEFITKTYPDAKVSDEEIIINGNIYTIKQNGNEWDFKLEGNTFTYQQ